MESLGVGVQMQHSAHQPLLPISTSAEFGLHFPEQESSARVERALDGLSEVLLDADCTLSLELGPLGPEGRRKTLRPERHGPYTGNTIIVSSQRQINKTCVERCFVKIPSV